MKSRGSKAQPGRASARRLAGAALVAAVFAIACGITWTPWIPGERSWNPDLVVDPTRLSTQLPLDVPYVDELDCYSSSCQQRFRVALDQPGTLTVSLVPELGTQDARARIVLESIGGVLGQDNSGPGPHPDAVLLAVSRQVDRGVFFVLIQAVGGPMPFELSANFAPGAAPAPRAVARRPQLEVPPPAGPPPRLQEVSLRGDAGASFDPAVNFPTIQTFTFPPAPEPEPGAVLEQPMDRQIRRMIAENLTQKGFVQATGERPADLLVGFYTGARTRRVHDFDMINSFYDGVRPPTFAPAAGVDTRGTLTVDILDKRSNRLAWHAWTTRGLGPGITTGERTTALVREAVTHVLSGFPPR